MTIEKKFDISLIAAMALKEKQIQKNYRPIIAVHKWFARRPGTLFRGLVLSEFGNQPLAESFFRANEFPGRVVADPFMGGGIPLIEANRVGCDVFGFDINPMSAWIVREEIEHLDLGAYRRAADELVVHLERDVGEYYRTDCPIYGDRDVPVKYFIWVKVLDCEKCGKDIDLFSGYLLAQNRRHSLNVVICAHCGGRQSHGPARFEVIACIAGRGFKVRREDMKKLLLSTRGKVFTLENLDRLVECSRLAEFKTR